MTSAVELMISEHKNILRFNHAMRNACISILAGKEVYIEDFRKMILFARNYADKHHHGKEEQILFKEMVEHLGKTGANLITHGMLVEHDLGRLFILELEAALDDYSTEPTIEARLDIIANAVGYTKLLKRHIDKEDEVVYTYAQKQLSKELLADINLRTDAFEKQAEASGVQKNCYNILIELENKYC